MHRCKVMTAPTPDGRRKRIESTPGSFLQGCANLRNKRSRGVFTHRERFSHYSCAKENGERIKNGGKSPCPIFRTAKKRPKRKTQGSALYERWGCAALFFFTFPKKNSALLSRCGKIYTIFQTSRQKHAQFHPKLLKKKQDLSGSKITPFGVVHFSLYGL